SGLGITLFGVFMASVYTNTIALPSPLDPALGAQAARSISDSIVVAQGLAADQAEALINAAKAAFSTTHSILLTTAAILIALLSVVVFLMLGGYQDKPGAHE
ncbi:MAG: MFS transporter, partial [Halomonas sp.]